MRLSKRETGTIALLLVASLLVVLPSQMVKAQTATVGVTPQQSDVSVGQTFTVNITISNIQNLYAVDITLIWATSILSLVSNQSFVGVSGGVLNTPVSVVQDTATQANGEYHLIATSENPAGPFSGSATVATLKFTATQAKNSFFSLNPQLASYAAPGSGNTSEFINDVEVVNGHVSVTSTSSSPTPTTSSSVSPSSTASSPTPSPSSIPEFPTLATLAVVIALGSVAMLVSVRKIVKPKPNPAFNNCQWKK